MTDSCVNLAPIEERNIRKLVPRVHTYSTPLVSAPSTSAPSASAPSASALSASAPSASATIESQLRTRSHYTRSQKSQAVPDDLHQGGPEDTLDTIIV